MNHSVLIYLSVEIWVARMIRRFSSRSTLLVFRTRDVRDSIMRRKPHKDLELVDVWR